MEGIVETWEASITEKQTSSIWRLIPLLVPQPVVDAKFVAARLDITDRAARDVFLRAQEYGILRRFGSERRGVYYQSDAIIEVMDEISDVKNLRRLFSLKHRNS